MAKLSLSSNKMVCGVVAGIVEYLNIDVTIARIAYAVITLISAGLGGLIAYAICYIIMKNS